MSRRPDFLFLILPATFALCAAAAETESPADTLFPPPHGIRTGRVTLFPTFNYDLTYSDNANRSDKSPKDDFINEFTPGLRLAAKPSELISFDALYEFGWHDYAKDSVPDYLSHRVNAEVRVKNIGAKGLDFIAGDRYLQTGNSGALENEIISFTRFNTNEAYGRLDYDFNRFHVSGEYKHRLVDYFSELFAMSDYTAHSGEISAEYRYLPEKVILFGTYNATRYLRNEDDSEDFDSHSLLFGVRGKYSKLSYSVAAGYSIADRIHNDASDDGPAVLASLTYRPKRRLDFTIFANRQFVAGVQSGVTTETIVGLNAGVSLMRRARLLAGLSLNDSDRQNDVSLRTAAANITFEYRLTRFALLSIGYTHYDRATSRIPAGDFKINETHFGFRFTW